MKKMKKKKKKIIILFLMLIILCMIMMLSGCDEQRYPAISIDIGLWSSPISIDVGNSYVYKGFDSATTNDDKDIILHFEKNQS